MSKLFQQGKLGDIDVKNRVFMAPLTRNRAQLDGTPNEIAIKYYAQRASAGLIITEGAQISPRGQGYFRTPGIYNAQHVAAWRSITDAVHAVGGKIVLQLWHVGRISHVSFQPNGEAPIAPSVVKTDAEIFTADGPEKISPARTLHEEEIPSIIAEYVRAARLALEAGFDGVEVHGANGYLLNQFISTNTNKRGDGYGGSVENRAKLLLEVADAVAKEIGQGRVGVRLSPTGTFNDIKDQQAGEAYAYIYAELGKRDLAYLHVAERFPGYATSPEDERLISELRATYRGNYIANGGYDKASATNRLDEGTFAVAFGRDYISNPDLVTRLDRGSRLAEVDQGTIYGGDEKGYSDYPVLEDEKMVA